MDSTEEKIDECQKLLEEVSDEMETDRQERMVETLKDQFQGKLDLYNTMKPSIDRLTSDKRIMKQMK